MLNKLKVRTTIMVVVVIFLTVIINFIVGNTILKEKLYGAYEKEAFTVVKAIERQIDYTRKYEEIAGVHVVYNDICESILDSYDKLEYILVVDDEGNIPCGSGIIYDALIQNQQLLVEKLKYAIEGSFEYEYEGIKYLSFFQPVYSIGGEGIGAIIIGYKQESIMGPIYMVTQMSLSISLVVGAISVIIISVLIHSWISNPLQRLIRATQQIGLYGAEGMPAIRIESKSEIGDLGRQYNLMLSRLQKSMVSKTYLDSIIANMSDALFVLDTSLKIQTVNHAALSLLGYEKGEIIGTDVERLFDVAEDTRKHCEKTIRQKGVFRNVEAKMVTKQGKRFPILCCGSLMKNKRTNHFEIILNAKDITERKIMQDAISYRANHDMLTGLSNRYALAHEMEQAFKKMEEGDGQQHIFLYMDLDNFKTVNDECGHKAGDELIKQLTQIMKTSLRETDILTRLGGDEFGALLLNTTMETGVMIGMRICEVVNKFRFRWANQTFQIGISIGASSIDAYNKNPDQIIAMADQACYVSKENGGNYVAIAENYDHDHENQREQVVYDIKGAINNRQLHLEYESVKELHGTDKTQYEIVLRMTDENGKIIMPSKFYPEVRRRHLCVELDQWVFEQVCMEYHDLAASKNNPHILINISKEAMENHAYADFVCQKTEEYSVPKENICFEIEESQIISYYSDAAEFITSLSQKGFEFMIDHFGSGLSGYMHVRELPVKAVKIDSCFIQGILENELDTEFVTSIINMARMMKKRTIATGVESQEIVQRLSELGVDAVQGKYISVSKRLNDLI